MKLIKNVIYVTNIKISDGLHSIASRFDRKEILQSGILKKDSATFFVNLRCMRFYQNTIELFAGAGITEDSDPTAEWEETEKKIAAIKQLLEN